MKGEIPKLSSGQGEYDWIYVDDVVEGLLAAAQVPQIEGATFDLGSGQLVTVREMIHRLVEVMDCSTRPKFGALPDRPLQPVRKANVSEALDKLSWRAKVPLEIGLQRTVEWYKGQLSASSMARQSG